MCDIDGEYSDVWNEYTRKARKKHTCMACDETIRPGHSYHRVDSLYDGVWDHWIHCLRCWAIFEALFERARDDAGFGAICIDPSLNCGEEWKNPPPEIAALAFALPGEIAL